VAPCYPLPRRGRPVPPRVPAPATPPRPPFCTAPGRAGSGEDPVTRWVTGPILSVPPPGGGFIVVAWQGLLLERR
jgi:hypothetical protein